MILWVIDFVDFAETKQRKPKKNTQIEMNVTVCHQSSFTYSFSKLKYFQDYLEAIHFKGVFTICKNKSKQQTLIKVTL